MMRSEPHQTTIGKRVARHVATAHFRSSGHMAGSPNGEVDQSCARISAPIFPPPERKPTLDAGVADDMHAPCASRAARIDRRGHPFLGWSIIETPLLTCLLLHIGAIHGW